MERRGNVYMRRREGRTARWCRRRRRRRKVRVRRIRVLRRGERRKVGNALLLRRRMSAECECRTGGAGEGGKERSRRKKGQFVSIISNNAPRKNRYRNARLRKAGRQERIRATYSEPCNAIFGRMEAVPLSGLDAQLLSQCLDSSASK